MSDALPPTDLFDADTLASMRMRDLRIALVTDAIDVQAELRDSLALRLVLRRLTDDATAAMMEFAFADLGNHAKVMGLQGRVFCMMYLDKTLRDIQERGQVAEAQINEEDGHGG